jgi:hypothetical protein
MTSPTKSAATTITTQSTTHYLRNEKIFLKKSKRYHTV